jgi:hypothetical protein
LESVVFLGKICSLLFTNFPEGGYPSMNENRQFESMKKSWDSLASVDFYKTLVDKLDFNKADDLTYVKQTVIEIVGKEHEEKVTKYVLPAILITAYYYKTGRETIILSKQDCKNILSMETEYIDVQHLPGMNRCIFMKINDGLLTATDRTDKILEVEGIYFFNKKSDSQNALLVYSVINDNGKYGFHYLSFPYGNEGNLLDYYNAFCEAVGLEENAFHSREILEFSVNALRYLQAK